jgi:hypothetical protein
LVNELHHFGIPMPDGAITSTTIEQVGGSVNKKAHLFFNALL